MSRPLLWRWLGLWLAVSAIQLASQWAAIRALALPDADDVLRMVQVRDLLAGQGFFDLHQYRIAPPEGVLMHWSRLVDLPLWAIASLLGERAALVLVPLLTLGAALLLVMRLAARRVDLALAAPAGAVLALLTPVTAQLQPLRIDHHGWQIVAALAALNGLAARDPRRGGALAGLAMALGLTISLELLPLAVLVGAVCGLRWLRDPREAGWLTGYCAVLASGGVAAFFATRGLSDLVNHCDTLSPAYLAALAVAAALVALLARVRALPALWIGIGLGLAALAAGALFLALAPACRAGPFEMLDPLVRQFWYANVREGMPVWQQDWPVLAQMTVPPLAGLWGAWRLRRRERGWWGDHALLLAGTIVLGIAVARSSALAGAFAAVPLAALLRDWYRRAAHLPRRAARIAALAGMVAVTMPALPVLGIMALRPAPPAPALEPQQACNVPLAAPALNGLAPGTILAPIDAGPMLLAATPHRVVATAHHRAASALHDLIAAFLAAPEQARALLAARRVDYVLTCPGLVEAGNYRRAAPAGLMARLAANRAPDWLIPVPLPAASGIRLWRVRTSTE